MIDAVIFDIGGVLRPPTGHADKEYFKQYLLTHCGTDLTDTLLNDCGGSPLREQVECWEEKLKISIDYDLFDEDTTEKQLEMIRSEKKDPQMIQFLEYLNKNNISIGVGTSSGRSRAKDILEILCVPYSALVTSDDVDDGRSKPEPDIYLEVVKKLNYPGRVLVIENSYLGIIAAKRASLDLEKRDTILKVIAYRKYGLEHEDKLSGPNSIMPESDHELSISDGTISDFSEIYAHIERLFSRDLQIPSVFSEAVS